MQNLQRGLIFQTSNWQWTIFGHFLHQTGSSLSIWWKYIQGLVRVIICISWQQLKWFHPIIFVSNIFHNSHLIQTQTSRKYWILFHKKGPPQVFIRRPALLNQPSLHRKPVLRVATTTILSFLSCPGYYTMVDFKYSLMIQKNTNKKFYCSLWWKDCTSCLISTYNEISLCWQFLNV